MWSVEYVECGVWSVECGVWSMENVFGGVTLDVTGPSRWRKEAIGFHSENGKK